jgi:hypothetical protein
MEPPLASAQPLPDRILLVADDPMTGAALAQHFKASGAEVFWAKDSMEARWLWMPDFFTSVVIRLDKDTNGTDALMARIHRDRPDQDMWVIDRATPAGKKPPTSVENPAVEPFSAQGKRKTAKLLQMPKRSRRS